MAVETPEDAPLESMHALVAYLRDNPSEALKPPKALAERFGLAPAFVQDILDGLRPPNACAPPSKTSGPRLHSVRVFFHWVRELFARITLNPMRFIFWTTAGAIMLLAVMSWITSGPVVSKGATGAVVAGWSTSIVFVLLLLHMACYYRFGRSRYPLLGGLLIWVVSAVAFMVVVWWSAQGRAEDERYVLVLLAGTVTFMLAGIYAGAGALCAVAGVYMRARRKERIEHRLSRQDLLERYFELHERLEKNAQHVEQTYWFEDSHYAQLFRKSPYVAGFLICAALTVIQNLCVLVTGAAAPRPGLISAIQALGVMVQVGLVVGWVTLNVLFGFLTCSVSLAATVALAGSVASYLADFIPIGSRSAAFQSHDLATSAFMAIVAICISSVSAVGAELQKRSTREANLQRNDPAAIAAEMLRIQWRLADHAVNVCVMVVDAAKSSQMKAAADPLAVEYSFREYQDWLKCIAVQFGGKVHSTAGDGAVIAFPNSFEAYQAARRVQTDLARFNLEDNRLKTPFRLRVGLHVGQVAGELDKVQFTEVIDVAAHIQGVSPIAGIAVSGEVAAELAEEEFVPLAREIDGHRVHLALNPTED